VADQPAIRVAEETHLAGRADATVSEGFEPSYRTARDRLALGRYWRPAGEDYFRLSALWVGGLMVLAVLVTQLLLQGPDGLVPRKLYDWALYISLGLGFVLTLGFAWFAGRAEALPRWVLWLPMALTLATLAGSLSVMIVTARWIAIPLAAIQVIGFVAILRRWSKISVSVAGPLAAASLAGWVAAIPLIWWDPLQTTLQRQAAGVFATAITGLAVTWWMAGAMASKSRVIGSSQPRVWPSWLADVLAVTVFVLLSFRTDGLLYAFQPIGVLSHWGAFVGPAQQVQEGGWLLWDVPALYGFLLTLTLAAFPFESAWQSLYVLNAVALFLVALAVYGVLRALRTDLFGKIVALAVTIPAVFLAALWPPNLHPTHYFPSFGPMRYLWCYVLIAIVAWESRQPSGSRGQSITLVAGTICWLVGVLWSFESAVFCSAIWLPTYAFVVCSQSVRGDRRRPNRERLAVALSAPAAMLGVVVAAVGALYAVRLGHLPDLHGYVEYVLAFGSGEVSQSYHVEQNALNFTDAHLIIVLVLAVVGGGAAMLLRSQPLARELPLLLALWSSVWLISGYSIARPHPHTVSRSWPIMLVAFAVSILIVTRRLGWRPTLALRSAAVPMVTMLLVLTYANRPEIERNVRELASSTTTPLRVAAGIPDAEPALQDLLNEANIGSDEPFVYDGDIGGNMMPAWLDRDGRRVEASRTWLPNPLVELILAPEERRHLYMQRMADRRQIGGWYVQRNGERTTLGGAWEASGPWFFDQLARTHVPTRALQNDSWQLVWFEYTGESGELGQPALEDGTVLPAPPQLSIDGTPVNDRRTTELWMIPESGWGQDPRGRVLDLDLPARASVFSDRDRRVTITLDGVREIDAEDLELLHGDARVGQFVKNDRRTATIEVDLIRGWNELIVVRGSPAALRGTDIVGETAGEPVERGLLLRRFDISMSDAPVGAGPESRVQWGARTTW
jgi:hypothetical protein